ncbi:MAG: 23S rRNA (adenine(2503)-C(2))-methyltransferase RlmN [Flavobacteriaceae bacterium]|nr:23S rRNA (adenine(2503)-C(2))-methyltransferase RlmN [Flavobacteriaceae bacterium]PHX84075.1 MAG: 23S rRNA (adenine(2503)-C(2))-methyltransferase RlmN [Flavobacteriales bacterium]
MEAKPDFRSLRREEVRAHFAAWAEPAYRADQVYDWLWSKGAQSFEEMSNLPKALRIKLNEEFEFRPQRIESVQRSTDGTIKNAVRLHDGLVVESVLIPTEKRITACVSSQVGCAMGCAFCATARLKRMRNLEPDEIYDQVRAIDEQGKSEFGRPLTNIVFMGMGEPLMNYKNTIEAIDRITSPKGLGMSPKRITLSTVGLPKMIRKLADDRVKFNLAVSLHSARDEVRAKIMPVNDVAPIDELRSSLEYWYAATKRKVTFEYVVWRDINDQPEDIRALVELAKRVPCKVNLIEYNSIGDERFRQASPEVLQDYVDALARISVMAKVRHSRGKDIDAACGQLANKKLPAELNSLE